MLAAIDLTHRQATRVLEQALRARARVEIEPRMQEQTICGLLVSREDGLLRVELHDHGDDWSLTSLVGAFCDVQAVLSGEMYRFCSCIMTAAQDAVPQSLSLGIPDVIQVSNRRRFDRKTMPESPPLSLWAEGAAGPLQGTLTEIGLGGLGCRLPRQQADDWLLIDDPVRLEFRLPGAGDPFELAATVCGKTGAGDGEAVIVGLEFKVPPVGYAKDPTFARLRSVLSSEHTGPSRMDGGA